MSKVICEAIGDEAPITGPKFANDDALVLPIGKSTCIKTSKVKKVGDNFGKTILRFEHDGKTQYSIGAGNFREACKAVGVAFTDAKGAIKDVTCQKDASSPYTIVK